MPNKKTPLPVPCPVPGCDANHGSIQAVIKNDRVFFKIRHYSKRQYNTALEELEKPHEKDEKLSHPKTASQRWHCFRSLLFHRAYDLSKYGIIPRYKLREIEQSGKMKTLTLTKNSRFLNIIKENGWQMRPNHSQGYRGRVRKLV